MTLSARLVQEQAEWDQKPFLRRCDNGMIAVAQTERDLLQLERTASQPAGEG